MGKKSSSTKSGDDVETNAAISSPSNDFYIDGNHRGMLKLYVTDISGFSSSSKQETAVQQIAELPWKIDVARFKSTDDNVEYLSIYVSCNDTSESHLWSCNASIDLRLLSSRMGIHGATSHSKNFTNTYNHKSKRSGIQKFIAWNLLTSTDLGYLKNDEISIEAHITIQNLVGVYNNLQIDFLASQPNVSDIIINVDGNQLHLNKTYLAMYSRYFYAMFFSTFEESKKSEIVINDVKFDQFIEMLKVIYPTRKKVDAQNVDSLLRLGDQFDVRFVIQECEEFLIMSKEITIAKKLLYADQYYLSKLMESCLRTMNPATNAIQELKAIQKTVEYGIMSDSIKIALLEKCFKSC